jgi:hypothetical protein
MLRFGGGIATAQQVESRRAPADIGADTVPESDFWHGAAAVFASSDTHGNNVPSYKMEVRTRWTPGNLYFLFISPYDQLYLKPDPSPAAEVGALWKWDVAEVFIGSDFAEIRRYKEFEVSPQAEWMDSSVDLSDSKNGAGVKWNSGFEVSARVDSKAKVWYTFMRIPYSSVDSRPAAAGNLLRVNFFLSAGRPGNHKLVTWRPTGQPIFHVPEAFGTLTLME